MLYVSKRSFSITAVNDTLRTAADEPAVRPRLRDTGKICKEVIILHQAPDSAGGIIIPVMF